jgi:hypothetical protein
MIFPTTFLNYFISLACDRNLHLVNSQVCIQDIPFSNLGSKEENLCTETMFGCSGKILLYYGTQLCVLRLLEKCGSKCEEAWRQRVLSVLREVVDVNGAQSENFRCESRRQNRLSFVSLKE